MVIKVSADFNLNYLWLFEFFVVAYLIVGFGGFLKLLSYFFGGICFSSFLICRFRINHEAFVIALSLLFCWPSSSLILVLYIGPHKMGKYVIIEIMLVLYRFDFIIMFNLQYASMHVVFLFEFCVLFAGCGDSILVSHRI